MLVADLRDLCVDAFPGSKTRDAIMAGLEKVVREVQSQAIVGELWVNGSFLTEKVDPEDVDLVLRLESHFVESATPEQMATIDWLQGDLKANCHCDSYVFVEYAAGQALAPYGEWMRAYWIRQFGFSRGDEVKGIALVTLQ